MSWKKYVLGDILKRKRTREKIDSEKEYKLVTIKLYHKGVIPRTIVKGATIKSPMSSVKSGDFVLSGIDARNGAFGIVPKELDGALITNDFWCIEPDETKISKDFFLYITSTAFFDYICKQSSDGTTQRIRLQKDRFFNYEIALPTIEEQKEILKQLNLLSETKVELTKELNHQLDLVKQLRQSFLREAMQGKVVKSTNTIETGQQLLEKIKAEKAQLIADKKLKKEKELAPITEDEIPFEIPEHWAWCRLGEIVNEILGGYAFDSTRYSKTETQNQVIRLGNVKHNQLVLETGPVFIDEIYKEEVEKAILKVGDILITMTGTRAKRDYLFSLCISKNDLQKKNLYLNQRVGCFRFSNLIAYNFMNVVLKEIKLLEPIFDSSTGAANQANIGITALKEMLVPLPPLHEQEQIVAKLEELMGFCDGLEQSIKESQGYNEMLLQQVLREALQGEEAK